MPAINDLTVKMSDGTTDIIYTALKGSGGDGDPAVWRQDTGQAAAFPMGLRPTVKFWGTNNGPKTARRLMLRYDYPVTVLNSTTGRYELVDTIRIDGTITLPTGASPTAWKEAVCQYVNLCANITAGGVRNNAFVGYPPT